MHTLYLLLALGITTAACSPSRLWAGQDSCVGRCGAGFDSSKDCQCNSACTSHNDCCTDYEQVCTKGSCQGRCGNPLDQSKPCQCNEDCQKFNDCCSDYNDLCSQGISEADLINFTENLFSLEVNNVGKNVDIQLGCTTSVGNTQDCSKNPLFLRVDESIFDRPVYKKLNALFNNYDKDVTVVEDHTNQEQQEEHDFLQEVLDSNIMKATYEFLEGKGVYSGSYQNFGDMLYTLWFGMYERANNRKSSSGFEHVFLGEVKNGDVSGFHNWFRWYTEERSGHMNYLGYWRHAVFPNSMGDGLEFTFLWDKVQKPYGSMLIGTSPELELAIYTTCFLALPDAQCHVKLGGTDVYIQTFTYTEGGKTYVGTAYPDFSK